MRVISPAMLLLALDAVQRDAGKTCWAPAILADPESSDVLESDELESDGRIIDFIDPDDEITWPVERTDVFERRAILRADSAAPFLVRSAALGR